jgi:quercetin dioxygenase-like cupin family protein
MSDTDRRFTLALGLSAVSGVLTVPRHAVAQTYRPDEGVEVQPGVRRIVVKERTGMPGREFVLPGYKRIRMVDFVFQPGVERKDDRMPTDMVCLCTEGEMRIDHRHGQEHAFSVSKGDVWTCVKDQPEDVKNTGSTAAVMRVISFWPI